VELNLKKITFTPRYRIINITEDEYEDSETTFYTLKAGKYTKYTGDYDDKEQYYVVSNPTLMGTITYVYLVNSSNNFS
jgi:hypothetical protein